MAGSSGRELPRAIEVLVKKAAIDADFRALLLEERAEAAKSIALELVPAEAAMLMAIPAAQLETIIASTKVDEKVRPAFLGRAAAVMIATLGLSEIAGCNVLTPTKGARADRPPRESPAKNKEDRTEADDDEE